MSQSTAYQLQGVCNTICTAVTKALYAERWLQPQIQAEVTDIHRLLKVNSTLGSEDQQSIHKDPQVQLVIMCTLLLV